MLASYFISIVHSLNSHNSSQEQNRDMPHEFFFVHSNMPDDNWKWKIVLLFHFRIWENENKYRLIGKHVILNRKVSLGHVSILLLWRIMAKQVAT